MKYVKEIELLNYLKNLIFLYQNEKNIIRKENIAKDFYNYVTTIDYLTLYSKNLLFREFGNVFYDYYNIELKKALKLNEIFKKEDCKIEQETILFEKQFNHDDLEYITYLINKIYINYNFDDKPNLNYFNLELIKDYIKDDIEVLNCFKQLENNIWYNSSFGSSTALSLSNNDIIFTRYLDVSVILHEFIHIYSDNIKNNFNITKYRETPTILSEVGISSCYGVKSNINRFKLLEKCKENLDLIELEDLIYIIGTIIAISFIYKNSNSFKIIKSAIEFIINNCDMNFIKILDKLNITEQNIIEGFNNVDKVLKYKPL